MLIARTIRLLAAALAAVALLQGYTRLRNAQGSFQFRSNPSNIQFRVQNQTHPGLLNGSGGVTITADSDPLGAITAAQASWAAIPQSTVSFAALLLSGVHPEGSDGQNTITFADTTHNRQVVGDAIAVTLVFSSPSGAITESDIFLNPAPKASDGSPAPFSSTGAEGTFDIESTVLHELGHALGMEHSNVMAAALWPFSRPGEIRGRDLTADDIAFAVDFHPALNAQAQLGRIRGTATLQGGGVVRSGMAVAVNRETGVAISAQTGLSTGAYSLLAPPGEYVVYLESVSGQVSPGDFSLTAGQVTTPFPVTRFGGAGAGQTVTIGPGDEATANFAVAVATPSLDIGFVGLGPAGQALNVGSGAFEMPPGQWEVYLWGPGMQSVAEPALSLLGPGLEIVPGSTAFDNHLPFGGYGGALHFRVTASAVPGPRPVIEGRPLATILIESGGLAAAATGALVLEPPATVAHGARLGVFTDGAWFLDRNGDSIFDQAAELTGWGSPGDTPVLGDWNGDGTADLGAFSGGLWFLDLNGDGAFDPAEEMKGWGVAGWTPMVGDWNGDGRTNLGVVAPDRTWFLDLNGDFVFDPAAEVFGWGSPGSTPLVGDWNGDGRDKLGVFVDGLWFLDINGDGVFDPATEMKGWGVAGWTPVVGDWNGDGRDKIGAVTPDSAWFRDVNGDFVFDPNTEILGWGSPGDKPVVADWNGDGAESVGVFSGGLWFIDIDGDGSFDPASELKGWGVDGWTPVPAAWR